MLRPDVGVFFLFAKKRLSRCALLSYAKMQAQSRSVGNSCRTAVAGVRTAVAARQLQQRGQRKKLKNERDKKKRQQQQEREAAARGADGEDAAKAAEAASGEGAASSAADDAFTAEEVRLCLHSAATQASVVGRGLLRIPDNWAWGIRCCCAGEAV